VLYQRPIIGFIASIPRISKNAEAMAEPYSAIARMLIEATSQTVSRT